MKSKTLRGVRIVAWTWVRGEIKFLTSTRTGDSFTGLLQLPGGGIEDGETPLVAAIRELYEETGLTVPAAEMKFQGSGQIVSKAGPVDMTTFCAYLDREAQPRAMEPDKQTPWLWTTLEEARSQPMLPGNLEALDQFFKVEPDDEDDEI